MSEQLFTGRQACRSCRTVYLGRVSTLHPGEWSPYCRRCEHSLGRSNTQWAALLLCGAMVALAWNVLWEVMMEILLTAMVFFGLGLLWAWWEKRNNVRRGRFGRVMIVAGPHGGKQGDYKEDSQPCTHRPQHGQDDDCDSPWCAVVFLDGMDGAHIAVPFDNLRKERR